jgi:hypothetical protein
VTWWLTDVIAIDPTATIANGQPPSSRQRRVAQIASMKNGNAAVW